MWDQKKKASDLQNDEYLLCCLLRKIFPCMSWPEWDSCRIWPSRAAAVCTMALLVILAEVWQTYIVSWDVHERKMLMKDTKFKNALIILGFHWPLFYCKTQRLFYSSSISMHLSLESSSLKFIRRFKSFTYKSSEQVRFPCLPVRDKRNLTTQFLLKLTGMIWFDPQPLSWNVPGANFIIWWVIVFRLLICCWFWVIRVLWS